MRPGELFALRWNDVALEADSLQVNRALSDGEFTPPKRAMSRRRMDLTARSIAALNSALR